MNADVQAIRDSLFALQDEKYADFNSRLIPGVPRTSMIGVRVPELRRLAKRLSKEQIFNKFRQNVPHDYFDENMLHALLINEIANYENCLEALEDFLPFVDNWAVCDILSPGSFKKSPPDLLKQIQRWMSSPEPYTCRFSMGMLMTHYLGENFEPLLLELPAAIQSEHYYIRMMKAWFFATALAKQWEATVPYICEQRLEPWVHHKTIQKACESYRLTPEQKSLLKNWR